MNRLMQKSFRVTTSSLTCNCRQALIPLRTKKTTSSSQGADIAGAQSKAQISPRITLIGQNQAITITSLKEAQKLSKRRDLNLVQLQEFDTKTQRPVYKLVTAAEMLSDGLGDNSTDIKEKKSSDKKSEKSLTIGSRISEHDLVSRLKQISKWLAKRHEVCILVQGNVEDMSSSEKIVKAIEASVREPEVIGRIVQKRTKGSNIKFNILPVDTAKTVSNQA